jgi:hypothetical protein
MFTRSLKGDEMIKLLHKPSGKTLVVSDEEAVRTMNSYWKWDFVVLESGLSEESEGVATEDELKQAEQQPEELSDEVPNEAIQQPTKPSLKHVNEDEYLAMDLDLDNATPVELRGYCKRLGIKVLARESKKSMIEKLRKTGIIE